MEVAADLGDVTTEVEDRDQRFAAFFLARRAAALRLAYALTGDQGVAEDIAADAFARMYAPWRRGRIRDPDAYLRRTIVNSTRGRFRRRAVRRRYEASQRGGEPAFDANEEAVVDRARLLRALTALTPRQRAVVVLRVVDDMSEADTANVLRISHGAVKAHLSRGLARLRTALDDEVRS